MAAPHDVLGAAVDLSHPGHYLHWGPISISYANLVVVGIMLLLFALALFVPFPREKDGS